MWKFALGLVSLFVGSQAQSLYCPPHHCLTQTAADAWSCEQYPSGGMTCAAEKGTCNCVGKVSYGTYDTSLKDAVWVEPVDVDGSIECTNDAFGGDPAHAAPKACTCSPTGATATTRATAEVQATATNGYVLPTCIVFHMDLTLPEESDYSKELLWGTFQVNRAITESLETPTMDNFFSSVLKSEITGSGFIEYCGPTFTGTGRVPVPAGSADAGAGTAFAMIADPSPYQAVWLQVVAAAGDALKDDSTGISMAPAAEAMSHVFSATEYVCPTSAPTAAPTTSPTTAPTASLTNATASSPSASPTSDTPGASTTYTVSGELHLTVTDPETFAGDANAKTAVEAGIATTVGVAASAVSATLTFVAPTASPRRLQASAGKVKVEYVITSDAASQAAVTTAVGVVANVATAIGNAIPDADKTTYGASTMTAVVAVEATAVAATPAPTGTTAADVSFCQPQAAIAPVALSAALYLASI